MEDKKNIWERKLFEGRGKKLSRSNRKRKSEVQIKVRSRGNHLKRRGGRKRKNVEEV